MKVGTTPVSKEEFESTIGEIEPEGSGDPDKPGAAEKDRRRLGDDYATVLMLSQIALANHLDTTPDIRAKLAIARLQVLSDAQFNRLLAANKATPDEIKNYYQAHLSDFDQVQIRRLFIWKVGEGSKNSHGLSAEDAKARAAAIIQSAASGGDGIKLAEMFKDSDKGIFDAQPLNFVRGQLPANVDHTAFTMKPGQWAIAEDTPEHLILIYLFGRDRQPLSDVSSMVEKLVQGEKMQAQLDQLKKKTGIWMDQQYFGRGETVAEDAREQRTVAKPPSKLGDQ